jgi:hypothetical protein
MGTNNLKGLRIYLGVAILILCVFTYCQAVGLKWIGATSTSPPAGEKKEGYRYFYHK